MILLITGHQRSGTSLLGKVCGGHPDMTITGEFGNFRRFDISYRDYSLFILKRWKRKSLRGNWVYGGPYVPDRLAKLHSLMFVTRYLSAMLKYRNELVTVPIIEATLQKLFPDSRFIGDKYPAYIFLLDKFTQQKNMSFIVIYRDCRDVVSSTLKKARTAWRDKPFAMKWDSAEKVARRWVEAIELMENYKDRLHIIRYEQLVQHPKRELEVLGNCLGVAPSGFPVNMIRTTSIGKHRKGLSEQELEVVLEIAGPTMARLGYL